MEIRGWLQKHNKKKKIIKNKSSQLGWLPTTYNKGSLGQPRYEKKKGITTLLLIFFVC